MQIGTQDYPYTNVRDDLSTSIKQIEYSHHEIHEGDAYFYCECNDLGNGAVRDILIVTPNTTKWGHIIIEVVSELETDYKLYETTTASNNGTPVTAYNHNRNSSNTAGILLFHTPTVAGGSEGTLICQLHWGSGRSIGGVDRGTEEKILKQNTKYLLRITNATTNNNYISVKLSWYEHTNGE